MRTRVWFASALVALLVSPALPGTVLADDCFGQNVDQAHCSLDIDCSAADGDKCEGDVCTEHYAICAGSVESRIAAGSVNGVPRQIRAVVTFAGRPEHNKTRATVACTVFARGDIASITIDVCSVSSSAGRSVSAAPAEGAVTQNTGKVRRGRLTGCVQATVSWISGGSTTAPLGCNTFTTDLPG